MTHRLSIATLIAAGVSFIHALATRVLPPPPLTGVGINLWT